MSKDLLFEIGTEEIPAAFIPKALLALEASLKKRLEGARIGFKSIRTLGTPRRLTLIIEGLPTSQPDADIEVKGPSKKAAFDENGAPTQVLEGFARAQGVKTKDVKVINTVKGEYVCVLKHVKGEKTEKILPDVLKGSLSQELFPKSMRWSGFELSFARPVHWILASYGGKKIDFSFGHIKSSNVTFGHRFLGTKGKKPSAPVKAESVKAYLEGLKKRHVIADPGERKKIIREGLAKAAKAAKGEVFPDEGLLEEVTYLVEYPVVLMGGFDEEFLSLPRDIVINAMREHQRYFSVVDAKGGLLPYFLTVANTKAKKMDVVRKGNERVLRARLNDAKFYFDKDIKTALPEFAERLKGVVFQSRLGTSYEKAERFTSLALYIGERIGFSRPPEDGERPSDFLTPGMNPSDYDPSKTDAGLYSKFVLGRASMLSKADLVSGVVGEFPKLQGIMGSVYAKRGGEAPEVAAAIYEHYLPVVSGGPLPASVPGAIVSIADKLDTITGCFAVNLIPTGAQDPYALRRQSLGVVAIMLDKGFGVGLDELIDKSLELLKARLARDKADARKDVLEFFKERLKNQLLAQGLSFDSIDAVLSTPWFNIPDAVKRIKAIEDFKKHPACPNLVIAFKRVSNILKGAALEDRAPDQSLFQDPHEAALYKASSGIAPEINGCWKKGDYKKALETLASIKDAIDTFFDKVLVMADDPKIRNNRLLLLGSVRSLYYRTADLSKLTA